MQGIIWLASYPKSGNTWVRAYLANLLSGQAESVPFKQMAQLASSECSALLYTKILGEDFPIDDSLAVARNRTTVQYRLAASVQAPIFLKTHSYLGQADGHDIFNMNATRSAIYIIRNPLDVALSAAPHFNRSIDDTIEIMADEQTRTAPKDDQVFEKITDWSTHVKSWTQLTNPNLLVLRYEDLRQKPRKYFTKLARFLQLNKSTKEIQRAIINSSFKSLQSLEQKGGFSERPEHAKSFFRKGQTGQWRKTLNEAQIRKIIATHHEQMKRFNYIPKDYA